MKSKREAMQAKRQRTKTIKKIAWGILLVFMIALLGYGVFAATRPTLGEEIPVMADISHVAEGTDPGPYNSDPPTSGRHYAASLPAGFYHEEDVQGPYPEGYLVHSLEHGYVIFWYNCTLIDEQSCSDLKGQIEPVLDRADNYKVIAHPWESTDVPVVMTSWGRMLRFEEFDPEQAYEFIVRNRNKAPEPLAP
jgi:hypothetical protein